MTAVLAGLFGLLLGPFLHSLAVQAGADLPFRPHRLSCPGRATTSLTNDGADPSVDGEHSSYGLRCSCGRRRGRELLTALITGAGMAVVAAAIGPSPLLPAHLILVGVTTILIVTDLDHFRIPNRILYPGTGLAVGALGIGAVVASEVGAFGRGLAGGVAYLTLFLAVYLAARGQGFGFGDVKLAFVLGVFGAFHSWQLLVRALFITALLGGIPAIVLLIMGKSRTTFLPYGPPLILGTWFAIAFFS